MAISLALSQIFTGASASLSNRWQFCSFFDKVLFAQSTVLPQYWPGYGTAMPIPGLPVDNYLNNTDEGPTRWDGVLSYEGHVMGFQGSTLTWSDVNDFTNYIPVSNTIQDVVLTLVNNLTQPSPDTVTPWVFFNESTYGMVADMYVRIDYLPYYNFYTVVAVSLVNGVTANSEGFDQPVAANSSAYIFTDTQVTWAVPKAATTAMPAQIGFLGTSLGGCQATVNLNQTANVSGVAYTGSVTTTGTTASGSNILTLLDNTDGIMIGMAVSGAGVPSGTTVTAVQAGGTTAYLSNACTASGTPTLTFTTISGIYAGQIVTGFGIPAGTTVLSYNAAAASLVLSNPSTITEVGVTLTFNPLNTSSPLQILDASATQNQALLLQGFTAPAIGSSVTLQFSSIPFKAGDYVSFGDPQISGLDIYSVSSVTEAANEYITNATSSTGSTVVTTSMTALPVSLVVGATMLGQIVSAITGTSGAYTIQLSGYADAVITGGIVYYLSPASGVFVRLGLGIAQNATYPIGTYVITQPYVQVYNSTNATVDIPAFSAIKERYGLQLSLENLTGAAPAGTVIIGGTQVLSLNANEAGQLVNAGDRVNGPIWAMSTSGLYAVIMKERSFQSIQYVGTPQIFNIWPEFTDEGLLGRNTWCKVGENTIYFWGHRAFFQFASGSGDPTPIGQKAFVQVLAEIDLTRVSEACMYHKEDRREVWFVYPVQGYDENFAPSRVFIYNYEQGSISIDDYADLGIRQLENGNQRVTQNNVVRVLEEANAQSPITAVGSIPVFITALEWQALQGDWQDLLISWNELTGGRQFVTLMGLYPNGSPNLVSHGTQYDRDGAPIYSEWQSPAHDGGDALAFKYTDLVQFSLAVNNPQIHRPFRLYVQLGVQENLDSAIVWSTPQFVDYSGNGQPKTKVNIKMAGRLITLKVFSGIDVIYPDIRLLENGNIRITENGSDRILETTATTAQWRIAGYEISGRLGNTY